MTDAALAKFLKLKKYETKTNSNPYFYSIRQQRTHSFRMSDTRQREACGHSDRLSYSDRKRYFVDSAIKRIKHRAQTARATGSI
jgi:hypothetical protein